MIGKGSRFKSIISIIILLTCLTLMVNDRCHGYIMPAEQLVDFMIKNFSSFDTLVITQSTLQTEQDREKVFKEQVWLKSPDLFNLKSLDHIAGRIELPDMAYRQLLMANSRWRLEQLLSMMGVNLQSTAFTRHGETIAYRVGEKGPDSDGSDY